jgi:uncharacterized protein (DUF2141 family)
MKASFLILLFLISGLMNVNSQSDKQLKVVVTNLRSNKGQVIATIFKNKNGFPDQAKFGVKRIKVCITSNTAVVIFNDLPYGNYAIGVIHDENMNNTMDFGFLKIPKEGYGVSNDAKGHFGPPKFEDASFRYNNKNSEISININY